MPLLHWTIGIYCLRQPDRLWASVHSCELWMTTYMYGSGVGLSIRSRVVTAAEKPVADHLAPARTGDRCCAAKFFPPLPSTCAAGQ